MTTQKSGTPPDNWRGSKVAFVAYEALVRAGKQPGRDFSYQPRTQGRRIDLGIEVDFTFNNPSDLAMQVQESFYNHHSGIETRGTDVLAKAQLAGQGINLIMLPYEKLMQDPDWVVGQALQYRDHS
tara:strand:- start:555 stop:932 length:378 start_codon:yes stop_codon:yes gene_type:complete